MDQTKLLIEKLQREIDLLKSDRLRPNGNISTIGSDNHDEHHSSKSVVKHKEDSEIQGGLDDSVDKHTGYMKWRENVLIYKDCSHIQDPLKHEDTQLD